METRSRLLLAVAALALLALYAVPFWRIALEAPQYPEGIGMLIHLDTVTGVRPHDLKNINGLNHYIGMKPIHPEEMLEFKVLPWLMGGIIAFGLAAAALGKRGLLYAWAGTFTLVAVAGLVDFWWWEYDYGHNLDPNAAIIVPGMAYQPPLIGSKQLLNFTATSWPDIGGWIAAASILVGIGLSVYEFRRCRRQNCDEPEAVAAPPAPVPPESVLA